MKKIKQIKKEQVLPLLSNGEIIDLEHASIAFIRKDLSDKRCLHFTIEEVE